jgi:hypothetical protein
MSLCRADADTCGVEHDLAHAVDSEIALDSGVGQRHGAERR